MNPADAFRKMERKKEVNRNKMERKFHRDAHTKMDNPDEIKTELQELIELEQTSQLSKPQQLRKRVLQEAFQRAVRMKKVRAAPLVGS